MKSRAAATAQATAAFQTCVDGLLHLQADSQFQRRELLLLKDRVQSCEFGQQAAVVASIGDGAVADEDYAEITVSAVSVGSAALSASRATEGAPGIAMAWSTSDAGRLQQPVAGLGRAPASEGMSPRGRQSSLDLPATLDEAVRRLATKK
jgi:hypothetical protein